MNDTGADPLIEILRRRPAAGPGLFRVLVLEADGRNTTRDFADLEAARAYADDAASETEDGPARAYVYDEGLNRLYTGRHYADPE